MVFHLTDGQVELLRKVFAESERSPDNMAELSDLYDEKHQSATTYATLRRL